MPLECLTVLLVQRQQSLTLSCTMPAVSVHCSTYYGPPVQCPASYGPPVHCHISHGPPVQLPYIQRTTVHCPTNFLTLPHSPLCKPSQTLFNHAPFKPRPIFSVILATCLFPIATPIVSCSTPN